MEVPVVDASLDSASATVIRDVIVGDDSLTWTLHRSVPWIRIRISTHPPSRHEAVSREVFEWISRSNPGDDASAHRRCINKRRILAGLLSAPTETTSKTPITLCTLHSNNLNTYNTTMSLFSSRRRSRATTATTRTRTGFRNPLRRRDPDRVAGGYKAALSNPNTTRSGRKHAKQELRMMVSLVPFVYICMWMGTLMRRLRDFL